MERLLVFASGEKDGGGSGFQWLVENSRSGILPAQIVAVVSNHATGGVWEKAQKLGIPFIHMPGPYTAEAYLKIWMDLGSPWVSCSGWLKLVAGIPVHRIINIHPGPLPDFGGRGMFGHHVHDAVMAAYQAGKIKCSAVTMHFVDPVYDHGPIIFQYPVMIRPNDTAQTLGARVNEVEHGWQSWVTGLVVQRKIRYEEGILYVPDWYYFHEPLPV